MNESPMSLPAPLLDIHTRCIMCGSPDVTYQATTPVESWGVAVTYYLCAGHASRIFWRCLRTKIEQMIWDEFLPRDDSQ
jgi:hypothetical protein